MENEHNAKDEKGHHLCQHEDKLCKEYAKRIKMVRDSRFATDANSYDAILLGSNCSQSLKNSISGEWEFKQYGKSKMMRMVVESAYMKIADMRNVIMNVIE
mgnify:CR=1 FL=1